MCCSPFLQPGDFDQHGNKVANEDAVNGPVGGVVLAEPTTPSPPNRTPGLRDIRAAKVCSALRRPRRPGDRVLGRGDHGLCCARNPGTVHTRSRWCLPAAADCQQPELADHRNHFRGKLIQRGERPPRTIPYVRLVGRYRIAEIRSEPAPFGDNDRTRTPHHRRRQPVWSSAHPQPLPPSPPVW